MTSFSIKINHKTADKITVDTKGVTCELWVIPGYQRYYLLRRNGDWGVWDRKMKRPMSIYVKSINGRQYNYCMLVNRPGYKGKHLHLHRLIMQCLSLEEETSMVKFRNDNSLDNRFENLYYYRGNGPFKIRNTHTGEVFEGNQDELHKATGLSHRSVVMVTKGEYIKGFELVQETCNV